MSAEAQAEGRAGLAALDRALAARPRADGPAWTETTTHLCNMRDALIAEGRTDGRKDPDLDRLNAVISAVLGGHFPLGKIPWPEIESARKALSELLAGTST